jgi:biotin operon repressor
MAADPKPDMATILQAFLEQSKQQTEVLAKIDRRMTAVLSTPDREFVDRPSAAAPASAKRATRLSLPEQILKLIKQKPRETTELMQSLGISKTSVWTAIAQLERTQDAIVVSMPGERGRRGPSMVYHPSSPELAAMLRRSS